MKVYQLPCLMFALAIFIDKFSFTILCTEGCMYKGIMYQKGQQWQDGCQYNCICEDGMTGKYVCTERYNHLNFPYTVKRDASHYWFSVIIIILLLK